MQKTIGTAVLLAALFIAVSGILAGRDAAGDTAPTPFAQGLVSKDGRIALPENYRRDYVMLGAWSVAGDADTGGEVGLHLVYAPKDTVAAYRATGAFPDGAVLVKELFSGRTESLTTGEATSAASAAGTFIMVKDETGRFPGNPLWGDGWGWSFFTADDNSRSVTTDYRNDCLGCHEPARASDLIYSYAYPVLH